MRAALDKMEVFLTRLDIRQVHEVPYEVQRLLLFGFMHFGGVVTDDELEAWFWRSTFAEEHQSKPESYTTRLIREMRVGEPRNALIVRREVDYELFASRVRRSGASVSTGFDLLMRRRGARSLLNGEHVGGSGAFHGTLFSRELLSHAVPGPPLNVKSLANVAYLSSADAGKWRMTQRSGASLSDLFAQCERLTGEAEVIWATQGLFPPFEQGPLGVLYRRSEVLLESIVPKLER